MKKQFNDKLALTKETLRTLTGPDLGFVEGRGTTDTSETSNPTLTDTCIGPSCRYIPQTTLGSACC